GVAARFRPCRPAAPCPSADSADAEVGYSTGTMAWSRHLSICLVQAVRPRLPIRTVTAAPAGRIFLGRRPMSGHSLDQARVADLDGIIWPAPTRTSNRRATRTDTFSVGTCTRRPAG